MNPKSYRVLIKPASTRVRCPVCHEVVYSRAGIHPQCAVRQSEPIRTKTKGQVAPLAEPDAEAVVPPIADVVDIADDVLASEAI
jgi:hypothetical protein